MSHPGPTLLQAAAAEVESHVAGSGWDRPPVLFALVRAAQFASDEPAAAAGLGLGAADPSSLTPVEQEALPDGPLDEVLARIAWPDEVAGCALSQEIVLLPPSAESDLDAAHPETALNHPDRREARIVAAVLRDGSSAVVLRLRRAADSDAADDLLTGPDLAPNLVAALLATLR